MNENFDIFGKLVQSVKLSRDKHIDDYTSFVLLSSIPDEYADVKSVMKNALKGKEMDIKLNGSSQTNKALLVMNKNKQHGKNDKGKFLKEKDTTKKKYDAGKKKTKKFYNCGGQGYYAKECRKPPKN